MDDESSHAITIGAQFPQTAQSPVAPIPTTPPAFSATTEGALHPQAPQTARSPYPRTLIAAAHARPFRVGLDVVAFSPQGLPRRVPDLQTPRICGGFGLRFNVKRRPTDRFLWTRRAEYVHETLGHHLTIFFERASPAVPPFYLKLRPGPGQLFSPQDVVDLLALVGRGLHLPPLRLSSIELAADFNVSEDTFERLGAWLWAPKVKRVRRVGEHIQTIYLGSPKSGKQVKWYWKVEAEAEVARLEYTFRRKGLRRLGIARPADLLTGAWPRLAAQSGRFVELDTARTRRDAFVVLCLRHLLLHDGVLSRLRGMGARNRRWMRERFVSLPVQANLEAALGSLAAGVPRVGSTAGRSEAGNWPIPRR